MRNANHIVHRKIALMQLHQAVLLCCLQILRRFLINYQYNVVGNRVSSIYEHPPSVNETTTYGYDAENRLTGIQITTDNKTRELAFAYDPFGRRISKTLVKDEIGTECAAPNTCPRTTYYAYDGANIILEYNQAGTITARYTHGPNIDEPLAIEITGATAFTPYYYHADGLGSITALSNATGNIVQRYEYDSFGNQTITTNGNIKQPFTFTAREYDTETGMYFYRARYYDQKVGRFVTKDPISFAGGDVNLYAYVLNNPVNLIDPDGLSPLFDPGNGGFGLPRFGGGGGTYSSSVGGKTTRFISGVKIINKKTGKPCEGTVDLKPTLDRINSGERFPHRNDGSVFKNNEKLLPQKAEGYYKEFVQPTPGIKDPGPQLIITGTGGEMYYTPDHYRTFIPLK